MTRGTPAIWAGMSARPRRVLSAAAGASAVLLLGAACSIDLSHLRPGADDDPTEAEDTEDAAPILEASLDELATWPAVQVDGQAAQGEEDPWETNLTVADGGAVHGTLNQEGSEVEVMEAEQRLFLAADETYWLSEGAFAVDSDTYQDHWVHVPDDFLGANPREVFQPELLSQLLGERAPEEGTEEPVEDDVDGVEAYRISVDGGDVWVSAAEPHEMLRLQISDLAGQDQAGEADPENGAENGTEDAEPEDGDADEANAPADNEADDEAGAGGDDEAGTEEGDADGAAGDGATWRTDVTFDQPEADAVAEFYDTLVTEAEELTGARDNRADVGWSDADLDMDCETGGSCTVSGTAENQASDGPTRVRMDVTVDNPDLGDETCNDTESVDAGESADLSCAVDFDLSPTSAPQSYEVEADAELSTRALSGEAVDDTVELLEEQRAATLDHFGEDADAAEDGDDEDAAEAEDEAEDEDTDADEDADG